MAAGKPAQKSSETKNAFTIKTSCFLRQDKKRNPPNLTISLLDESERLPTQLQTISALSKTGCTNSLPGAGMMLAANGAGANSANSRPGQAFQLFLRANHLMRRNLAKQERRVRAVPLTVLQNVPGTAIPRRQNPRTAPRLRDKFIEQLSNRPVVFLEGADLIVEVAAGMISGEALYFGIQIQLELHLQAHTDFLNRCAPNLPESYHVVEDSTRPSTGTSFPNADHAVAYLNHLQAQVTQDRPDGRAKPRVPEIKVGELGQLALSTYSIPKHTLYSCPSFNNASTRDTCRASNARIGARKLGGSQRALIATGIATPTSREVSPARMR
jgi:hypothetical protein